jgi:hypothetical protein
VRCKGRAFRGYNRDIEGKINKKGLKLNRIGGQSSKSYIVIKRLFMTLSFKSSVLFAVFLSVSIYTSGQSLISTNALYPTRFASKTWTPGFDLGLTFSLDSFSDFKTSFYFNRTSISIRKFGVTRTDFYLDKVGARLLYKRYTSKTQESSIKKGFFIGAFIDAMYAQTYIRRWKNEVRLADTSDGKGVLIGGGAAIGYTWKLGRFTLDPGFGFGVCGASQAIYRKREPGVFLDPAPLENLIIKLTPTHLDLTLGYALSRDY